jgi:Tfp pilus assembly protein PilF
MTMVAGPSRGPAREFTTIAALALVFLAGCCARTPAPSGLPPATRVERCGEQALREGRAVEARAMFFEAMRGQKCPFLSWIGVARASLALSDVKTAEIAISQAMQTNPGTAASFELVGRTVLMVAQARGEGGRGQALMADALLDRAQRMDPSIRRISYHRGLARLAANDAASAVTFLEAAIAVEGQDADVVDALMLAYQRTGQSDRARALFQSASRPTGELDGPPPPP